METTVDNELGLSGDTCKILERYDITVSRDAQTIGGGRIQAKYLYRIHDRNDSLFGEFNSKAEVNSFLIGYDIAKRGW